MLTDSHISSLRNVLDGQKTDGSNVLGGINGISSTIQNPIAGKLTKALFNINKVTANVETKIDSLITDAANSAQHRAKVELKGNTIVITVKPQDKALYDVQRQKIESKITSINNTLTTLNRAVSTLNTIAKTIQVLLKLVQVEEALMSINPLTKATFSIFKKAIKIVFLKEMLSQYSGVVNQQLEQNKETLNRLIEKFRSLHVLIKVEDEKNQGNNVDSDTAEKLITQDQLGGVDIYRTSETFTSNGGVEYILKVEKYTERKLIGRAYEKITGLLAEQTAPSIIAKPEQLMEELKTIINL